MERHVIGAGAQHLQRRSGAARALTAQASGDHGHTDFIAQLFVVGSAVDHVGIRRSASADSFHRHLGFFELQRTLAGGNQHEHALGTRQVDTFQERAGHGLFCCNPGAIGTAGSGSSHHGLAGLTHHGAHVFEVGVDLALHIDDFSNTADRVLQHVVGVCESFIL